MAIDFDRLDDALKLTLMTRKKPNKYRAKRTEYNGVMYDSKAEAEHARDLDFQITLRTAIWWIRQVRIPLGPDFSTRIDFLVYQQNSVGRYVVGHEVKGSETREFARVRKLWPKYGPFPLRIVKKSGTEIIEGKS